MSRYRPRYRYNTRPDIRVCPDIAFSDIVSPRHDIVSFFPISDPIFVISAPISVKYRDIPVPCQTRYYQYRARYRVFPRYRLRYRLRYRDIPVPCQTRYRGFHRYRARYGPDIAKNIGIYRYRDKKTSMSSLMCMQYRNIPISCTSDIGRFS